MINNLLSALPKAQVDEVVDRLLATGNVRIERIVSWGHSSPDGFWYDQLEHEWVLLVCGAARLQFEDDVEPIELTSGSFVFIPARRRHRVEWTADDEPTVWLAFFWKE